MNNLADSKECDATNLTPEGLLANAALAETVRKGLMIKGLK